MRYHFNAVIRLLCLLIVLVAVACGGGGSAPGPEPDESLDVDEETVQTWSRWATEAQQIAVVTAGMYQSRSVLPSQAAEQQAQAQALAEEIRAMNPSNELVLSVASGLDELVEALEFAQEFARNSGVAVSSSVLPKVFDALNQLAEDATALSETLETLETP